MEKSVFLFKSRVTIRNIYLLYFKIMKYGLVPPELRDENFKGFIKIGNVVIDEMLYDDLSSKLMKRAAAQGGTLLKETADILAIDRDLVQNIARELSCPYRR